MAGLGWRAVFLVNLPLGVLVLAGARFLREDRADHWPRMDTAGVVLGGVACAGVVVPTINAGMPPSGRIALVAVGLVAVTVLARHVRATSRRGRDPIVEPSLFRDRGFPSALLTSILYFAVSTGLVFVVVLYLQDGLGRSILESSLTVLPFSLGLAVSSLLAGQLLLPRIGTRLMLGGVALLGIGCLAGATVAGFAPDAIDHCIPVALGIAGLGGGLITVPFFSTALSRVRPHETGSAAGLLNSVQQLGGAIGVAGLGAAYLARPHQPHAGLGTVFAACAGCALAVAVTAVGMLRASSPTPAGRTTPSTSTRR